MRSKGKIATWKDDKGFGFIASNDGGPQVFIHIKAFSNRNRRPEIGEVVTYAVTKDEQGRTRAANATYAGEKLATRKKRKSGAAGVAFAWAFLATVGISVAMTSIPLLILIAYLVASVITYVAYAIDKSAAQEGRWRTGEGTLHLFALVGGWPGALIAQQTLRHKSRKTSFRFVFRVTVLLNCAALIWLHTADGRTLLKQLLSGFV